ncbi:MAG TPA: purine-nucleoside phosphorylase [Pirellulales bacterium]
MFGLVDSIEEAAAKVRSIWPHKPAVGIILGTGLGSVAGLIENKVEIAYEDVPHFPRSTVESHKGQLVCGTLVGLPVVAMEGRFHAYEGWSYQQITFPVRVMKALGADLLVVSNACGGLNPQFDRGDVMIIEDHINLMTGNPLIGVNDDRLGPRFPDMSAPYDRRLIQKALEVARKNDIVAHKGVYVAVVGPNLETRAEYRFLRTIGADVVGMSTVPEVITAVHGGMRVIGLSVITDMCLPDHLEPCTLADVIAIARTAEPKLRTIVTGVLADEAARRAGGV